ncbi:MAG TPA: hypothetical protein PKL08_02465 [Thermoanaerobaculaceae bacterium]|nr:hypothetical protein [Thermoanaerobaculaceae bacterium]
MRFFSIRDGPRPSGCVAKSSARQFAARQGWVAATLVMAATTTYTAAGGMRAGLLADATQGAAMAAFGVLLATAAIHLAGGPVAAVRTLAAARPGLLGSFGSFPPGRAASLYLLFALGTLAQPHYIQKFLFLRRRADLRRLPAVLTGALAAMLAVWLGVGLGGAALVAQGRITIGQPDELAPHVMTALGPWAVLLAATAVLAAMMSTAASFLNLAAAALVRDLPRAVGHEPRGVGAARFATVGVGVAATLVGVTSERAVAMLGVAGWGFFTAALLPAMTLGLAWPGARPRSVAAAMATGAVTDLVLEMSRASFPAALEPGLAGAALGTLVLVLGSAFSGDRKRPAVTSCP